MDSTEPRATVPLVDASAPLRGVVLCCTNIEPDTRTALAKHAEEMGAAHRYDLTSEVTHLISGHHETPKYRYVAKERPDVKILTLQWVEAVRQLWINDQPINLAELEKKHKRPTFTDLKICMTGFEDPLRTDIIDTVRREGGEYSGDLTKAMTHLIVKTPEGAKYKYAKQWGLRLVSKEWLFDSVERGMILEEKLYHPEMPEEERGKGAWVRHRATTPLKRGREESGPDIGTRKIRRTLSTKLQSQNEVVWGDIVGSGGNVQPGNGVAKQSSIADTNASSTLRTNSDVSALGCTEDSADVEHKTRGAFNNCRFYIHGFGVKRAETMRQHLVSHDAQVCATIELLEMPHAGRSFVVVPHNIPSSRLPRVLTGVPVVTEWWVERCLEAKSCLEPTPARFDFPFPHLKVENFEGMIVSSTGFSGYQLLHLAKVLELMGAKYDEYFTKDSSVLICNMQRQIRVEKLERAKEWHVPVVDVNWLHDSIKAGKKQIFRPYIVRLKKDGSAAPKSSARKPSSVSAPTNPGAFDGFDVSTGHIPGARGQEEIENFKLPANHATRDTTAFDKDADEEGELETLNDLLKRNRKSLPEPGPSVSAYPTSAAAQVSADETTEAPKLVRAEASEPEATVAAEKETSVPPLLSPAKNTLRSPPKSRISPAKAQAFADHASPRKLASPQKASPKKHPAPLLDTQQVDETITSLLTKPKPKPLTNSDPNQNPRRIFGRAPSNANNSSAERLDRSFTKNSSLAEQTKHKNGLERTASMGSVVDQLLAQEGEGDESQKEPTQTQRVRYCDEDAEAEQEQVMARMIGKKIERKPRERERTIGSLGGGRGMRATRRVLKDGEDGMGTSRGTGR